MNIEQALKSLEPECQFIVSDGFITWVSTDITQPTDAEITAETQRLQDIYDSQEYARNRKTEYDQLNQWELQFDDQRDGTSTWVDAINAIKNRNPK